MSFSEPELERAALQTIWQETEALGAKHGNAILTRTGLAPDDFTTQTGVELFGMLCAALKANSVPLNGKLKGEQKSYLETEHFRPATKLDAISDRMKALTVRRALSTAASQIRALAGEQELDATECLAKARSLLSALPARVSAWEDLSGAMSRVEKHIRDVADGKRQPCVATGFSDIDKVTGGFPATLGVIVAMPGVGKSAWVGSIIRNIAKSGQKCAIFSMEDASEWLAFRFLAHESGVSQGELRRKPLTAEEWGATGAGVAAIGKWKHNVMVDDRESLTPASVLAASREVIQRGARIIFLDNMTAMRFPRGERRDLEFQDFLVAARALANESGVPFVTISHAKRREGLDVGDLPLLTDCAESSAFEKCARIAYGLARDKANNRLRVGVLKNTNGKAWDKFDLDLNPTSALIQEEKSKTHWDWSNEVRNGTF